MLGAIYAKKANGALLSWVKICKIRFTIIVWNGSLGKNPRESASENLLEMRGVLFVFKSLEYFIYF